LAAIGPMLKPAKFGANEYIFTEGEYANESKHKVKQVN